MVLCFEECKYHNSVHEGLRGIWPLDQLLKNREGVRKKQKFILSIDKEFTPNSSRLNSMVSTKCATCHSVFRSSAPCSLYILKNSGNSTIYSVAFFNNIAVDSPFLLSIASGGTATISVLFSSK